MRFVARCRVQSDAASWAGGPNPAARIRRFSLRRPPVRRTVVPLVVGGALLAVAVQPAGASSVNTAYVASASGVVNVPQKVLSFFPGQPTSTGRILAGGSPGLVIRSGQTSASSTKADATALPVTLELGSQTVLTTSAASAHCVNSAPGVVSGSSQINGGFLKLFGVDIPVPSNPAPNTVRGLPGIARITFNRQTTAADGALTVQAIYVVLFNNAETADIAAVTCNSHPV